MKLVLLGTGGYYGNDRRHTACMMLPDVGIVLDAGSGLYRIHDYLVTNELSIFLSHAHLDHVIGLTHLLGVLEPELLAQTTIFGKAEKLVAIRRHLFAEELFPVLPAFRFESIEERTPLAAGGQLTYFPLKHPGGSVGFRLDWPGAAKSRGHSLAYVTDTTADPAADYVDAIRGVDVLIHEAYFLHDENQWSDTVGHSCVQAVAKVAAKAQVGRLVLVHMSPQLVDDADFDLAPAKRLFPATELGRDKMELSF
jgi:ribonuclease BN (tRNA processing enzyme)